MDSPPEPRLNPLDAENLKTAVELLEYPGFAARVADIIGTPLEKVMKVLPDAASKTINLVSEKAMKVALDLSLLTMKKGKCDASPRVHKLASAVVGAVGGAAGVAGLTVELPVTTAIMFRAIADVARAEGEDLRDPIVCLSCMEVFALGGPSKDDDSTDGIYFGARVALAQSVHEAARYLAKGIATKKTAPVLVRLISKIAAKFGLVVTYKAAAQLVPVIGALGGAAINTLFLGHFQDMAKGHFIVRRLERKYGKKAVKFCYGEIRRQIQIERGELMLEEPEEHVIEVHPEPTKPEDIVDVDFEVIEAPVEPTEEKK